jgi:uncharacterized protein (TIGR03437 family)
LDAEPRVVVGLQFSFSITIEAFTFICEPPAKVWRPTAAAEVMVYGTGFGVANPAGRDGLSWLPAAVGATIGGLDAEVTFAGLAPGYTPGLQQINIRIPEGCPTGAAVPIRLQLGGYSTQPGTTIAVE